MCSSINIHVLHTDTQQQRKKELGKKKETHSYSSSPTLNARKPLAALTWAHSWSTTEPDNDLTNWFLKWSFVNGPTHLYAQENEARPASIHFWALFLFIFLRRGGHACVYTHKIVLLPLYPSDNPKLLGVPNQLLALFNTRNVKKSKEWGEKESYVKKLI